MLRIISTRINHILISALTEDFDIKEFIITPSDDRCPSFQIGDIIVGRITNIVKNIQSIFVEIFPGVEGYLSYQESTNFIYANGKMGGKPSISDTILVQILKEPSKGKSYTLSSDFTFLNQYAVLKPQMNRIHISSKYRNSQTYKETRARFFSIGETFLKQTGAGFIARSTAMQLTDEEFENCLYDLYSTYVSVLQRGRHGVQYQRIYHEVPPHIRLLRDYHGQIEKIMTDDTTAFEEFSAYLSQEKKELKPNLVFYEDELMKLTNLYSLETNLEKALSKKVWLKSGAYLIIEHTEALTVIDVNSGKAISGKSVKQDTFLKINIEAAEEIAKQLRLRNLSGIIIIDFIDLPPSHVRSLVESMKEFLREDSSNAAFSGMTKLGLMELTRRRVGKPLHEHLERK